MRIQAKLLIILVLLSFVACGKVPEVVEESPVDSETALADESEVARLDNELSGDMSSWVGEFYFVENAPAADFGTTPFFGYDLEIHEDNGDYVGTLSIDGAQITRSYNIKVEGSQETAKIMFDSYLGEEVLDEGLNSGDVLFSMTKAEGSTDITTQWGEVSPQLDPRVNISGMHSFQVGSAGSPSLPGGGTILELETDIPLAEEPLVVDGVVEHATGTEEHAEKYMNYYGYGIWGRVFDEGEIAEVSGFWDMIFEDLYVMENGEGSLDKFYEQGGYSVEAVEDIMKRYFDMDPEQVQKKIPLNDKGLYTPNEGVGGLSPYAAFNEVVEDGNRVEIHYTEYYTPEEQSIANCDKVMVLEKTDDGGFKFISNKMICKYPTV